MIVLVREDRSDPQGRETALRGCFEKAASEFAGSFSIMPGAEDRPMASVTGIYYPTKR